MKQLNINTVKCKYKSVALIPLSVVPTGLSSVTYRPLSFTSTFHLAHFTFYRFPVLLPVFTFTFHISFSLARGLAAG